MTDLEIIDAMETYGGSFVKALGRAARLADAANREKIKHAFIDIWCNYSRFVDEPPGMPAKQPTEF